MNIWLIDVFTSTFKYLHEMSNFGELYSPEVEIRDWRHPTLFFLYLLCKLSKLPTNATSYFMLISTFTENYCLYSAIWYGCRNISFMILQMLPWHFLLIGMKASLPFPSNQFLPWTCKNQWMVYSSPKHSNYIDGN